MREAKQAADAEKARIALEKKVALEGTRKRAFAQQQDMKLEKHIQGFEKSLRAPGANLVPEPFRQPLETALAELIEIKNGCGLVANGFEPRAGFEVPMDLKHEIDVMRKHEIVFAMNVKAHMAHARQEQQAPR